MKKKMVVLVKYFGFLYRLYFYIFGFLIKLLSLFIKPDQDLILFNSFGGKKYDDSPKVLYEAMKKDARFKNYNIVWAFHEPEKFEITDVKKIKTDTLEYFKTALAARCWITNSGIERGLGFKGKKTFYFNTWHGTPLKKMGSDIAKQNKSFSKKGKSPIDIMTAQSDFEADIFARVFNIPRERFLLCGLPRNDFLVKCTEKQRDAIREELGLPKDKKVILYAPTFREYERDTMRNCVLIPPMSIKKWREELGDDYILLFRAHYEVGKAMNIIEDNFVKDMTAYPNLNDLMIASDVLISDYSSIFFDFSVMDKAMIHFTYDYDTYSSKRGMYFDIREMINGASDEDNVIKILKNMDWEKEKNATIQFRNKYINYYGNAVEKSLDCIIENIGE